MIRIGLGYDLHRLVEGRPLILGGVSIPHNKGLAGHSDADVLAHAVIDAILGAAALGNIGQHFPDTDPMYKDADSMLLLVNAVDIVRNAGYTIVNLDANIIAERPKLNPFLDPIRHRLAACLGVAFEYISVKAKTNEGIGAEGAGDAISVHAAVLLERSSAPAP